jgi:hypothetical protein
MALVQRLRLTSPALDFWVDANVLERDSRYLAVAEIGDEREIGFGSSRGGALRAALQSLGPEATESLVGEIGA